MVWEQGFETDTAGWFDNDDFADYGDITRVPSGTNGIASATGTHHAVVDQTPAGAGPFSRFDGYRDAWTGGFTAVIDVFLDVAWAAGSGFDYSVAINGSDNAHVQDFIFHVTKDSSTNRLLVAGSNNTNFAPREDLENVGNNYEVTSTGWYTFEHVFRPAVSGTDIEGDMNLYDSGGSLLFTETRTVIQSGTPVEASDVGGNRYGWFTAADVSGGVAIDNHELAVVPETNPATLGLLGLLLLGGFYGVARPAHRVEA